MTGPLSNEALALPMGTAGIFFFDGRNANDGTDVALATVDRE
jgi:hypothetical protein